MAIELIDIGTEANDGTGDTLRAGFDKANDNFSELYSLVTLGISQDLRLIEIAAAEGYQFSAWTKDDYDNVTSGTVLWPDGSEGVYTAVINATFKDRDSYTLTHAASGKTVTQGTVTRNASGFVTTPVILTVA